MATQKYSGAVAHGTPVEIDDMTSLAVAGCIHKGFIRLEMDEPNSSEPVVIYQSPKNEGTVEFRQIGDKLRIVAEGGGDASVTVFEES